MKTIQVLVEAWKGVGGLLVFKEEKQAIDFYYTTPNGSKYESPQSFEIPDDCEIIFAVIGYDKKIVDNYRLFTSELDARNHAHSWGEQWCYVLSSMLP